MGIPKFWKWLSDRQPQINQDIGIGREAFETFNDLSYNLGDYSQHSCDNLQLDLNSLVHAASHGGNRLMEAGLSTHMLDDIMSYIDFLVRICNPTQLVYLALDGVAPRAKMNQQRIRRFKTARDKADAIEELKEKGHKLPTNPFDSNCITPGTEFMTRLNQELTEYIKKKVAYDLRWNSIQVIFSGSDVPGEGEHKIFDYVRKYKLSKEQNPNTKHWIYGLDADLIILALISHELNFTIIREKVQLGTIKPVRGFNSEWVVKEFTLTHVNLIREYLTLDFKDLLGDEFDIEFVIDDLVLIMIFVGNDFVPRLPSISIKNGSLDYCIDIYKNKLSWKDRKMNVNGMINWSKLKKYMTELGAREQDDLLNIQLGQKKKKARDRDLLDRADREYTKDKYKDKIKDNKNNQNIKYDKNNNNNKQSKENEDKDKKINKNDKSNIYDNNTKNLKNNKLINQQNSEFLIDQNQVHDIMQSMNSQVNITEQNDRKMSKNSNIDDKTPNPNELILDTEFQSNFPQLEEIDDFVDDIKDTKLEDDIDHDWLITFLDETNKKGLQTAKRNQYNNKMKFDTDIHPEELDKLVFNYIEGLQFVILQQQKGVPSWGWQYGYHQAPMISDVAQQCERLLMADVFKGEKLLQFEQGEATKPLQQLLAVQPAGSRNLLPKYLGDLMVDVDSRIRMYQPEDFEEDQDNVKQRYEAVAIVPFIDFNILLEEYNKVIDKISDEELIRNNLTEDKVIQLKTDNQLESVNQFQEKVSATKGDHENKFKNYTQNNDLRNKLECTNVVLLSESHIKFLKRGSFVQKEKQWVQDPLMPTILNSRVKFQAKIQNIQLNTVGWYPTDCATVSLTPEKPKNVDFNELSCIFVSKVVNYKTPQFGLGQVSALLYGRSVCQENKKQKCQRNNNLNAQDDVVKDLIWRYRQLKACMLPKDMVVLEIRPMIGICRDSSNRLLPVFSNKILYVPFHLCSLISREEYQMIVVEDRGRFNQPVNVDCIIVEQKDANGNQSKDVHHGDKDKDRDRDKDKDKEKGIKLLNAKFISGNKNGCKIVGRYADLENQTQKHKMDNKSFTKLIKVAKRFNLSEDCLLLLISPEQKAMFAGHEQTLGLNWQDIDAMTHDNKMIKMIGSEYYLSDEAITKLESLIKNNQQVMLIIDQLGTRDQSIKIPKSVDKKQWQNLIKDINSIKNDELVNEHIYSQISHIDTQKEIETKMNVSNKRNGNVIYNNKVKFNKIIRQECSFQPLFYDKEPCKFKIGDRVMNVRNHWVPFGQIGYVIGVKVINIQERAANWLGSMPYSSYPNNQFVEPKTFLDVCWNSEVSQGVFKCRDSRVCRVSHSHVINYNLDSWHLSNQPNSIKFSWLGDFFANSQDQNQNKVQFNIDLMICRDRNEFWQDDYECQIDKNQFKKEQDRSPFLNQQIHGKLKLKNSNQQSNHKSSIVTSDINQNDFSGTNQKVITQNELGNMQDDFLKNHNIVNDEDVNLQKFDKKNEKNQKNKNLNQEAKSSTDKRHNKNSYENKQNNKINDFNNYQLSKDKNSIDIKEENYQDLNQNNVKNKNLNFNNSNILNQNKSTGKKLSQVNSNKNSFNKNNNQIQSEKNYLNNLKNNYENQNKQGMDNQKNLSDFNNNGLNKLNNYEKSINQQQYSNDEQNISQNEFNISDENFLNLNFNDKQVNSSDNNYATDEPFDFNSIMEEMYENQNNLNKFSNSLEDSNNFKKVNK